MKRLLILAPNWLGDAVMALPAIADIRRSLPDASIAVAARPSIAPLFGLVRDVDETILIEKKHRYPFSGFDAALVLPNSFHSALMVARATVPERWGYGTDCRGFLLTRSVRRAPAGVHQVEYYQQLVHALDFPNGEPVPRLDPSPDVREMGLRALHASGWDGRTSVVALAPGAAYGSAKRWPPESFAELASDMAADGVTMVMVGSAADRGTAQEVMAALERPVPILDLIGKTDLPTLAGVLAHCRTLVTNDSGAMHVAAALGVRVTAVFGPTDEHATGPRGEHTILTNEVWCRPCMLRECPLDHRCMRGIDAAAVLASARRSL